MPRSHCKGVLECLQNHRVLWISVTTERRMPVKTWRDKGGVKVRHFDCGDVNLEAEMEVVEE